MTETICEHSFIPVYFQCVNITISFLLRDDHTQICSCHNVTKGDVVKKVNDSTCKSIGDIKACTKAGTGCGGCMPLVQSIFNKQMKNMGQEVSNHCKRFVPAVLLCISPS
jgi:NAD(P)H-nitrite reductase large subunit